MFKIGTCQTVNFADRVLAGMGLRDGRMGISHGQECPELPSDSPPLSLAMGEEPS